MIAEETLLSSYPPEVMLVMASMVGNTKRGSSSLCFGSLRILILASSLWRRGGEGTSNKAGHHVADVWSWSSPLKRGDGYA